MKRKERAENYCNRFRRLKHRIFAISVMLSIFLLISVFGATNPAIAQKRQISLVSLLKNMRNTSHMAVLSDSKTAMASTWDTTGGNRDGTGYKKIKGRRNILLNIDGPGVIDRIFTGILSVPKKENIDLNRTHLQVFIDHQKKPVIDCPMRDFFSDNPFTSYPFVFDNHNSTYPGFLLPIPFNKHIKVQLWSRDKSPNIKNWGNYWQVTYTKYPSDVDVKSFSLPLSASEKQEIKKTGSYWMNVEKHGLAEPKKWDKKITLDLSNKKKADYFLEGPGKIKAMRIETVPNTPEALKDIRFRIYWDGMTYPSVDVPLGYFFGNADYASQRKYHSMFMGIDSTGGVSRFPMPFSKSARIEFSVPDTSTVRQVKLKLDYTKEKIDHDWGYFHTTWREEWATAIGKHEGALSGELDIPGMPKYGKHNVPVHIVMDRSGAKGKYVGMLLHVAWPSKTWWGEGDPLIWSDENGWPPNYHGTGTEEYFNSGWCDFDRKAISGYIKKRPGNVLVYSFHINGAFNFGDHFKFGLERWNLNPDDNELRSIWGTTAFWYAEFPLPAESKQSLLTPRLNSEGEWK